MADIQMCEGQIIGGTIKNFICPLRDKCHRYTAPKSLVWQSWGPVPYDLEKNECDMFIDNAGYAKDKKRADLEKGIE